MFIMPGLQAIFNAQFVANYIIYLWAKFRESGSNCSFVIAIKPKTEKKMPWAFMLLGYILKKQTNKQNLHEINLL